MKRLHLALLLFVGACGNGPKLGEAGSVVKVLDQKVLPAPDGTESTQPQRAYLIGPYDTLAIKVFGVDELSRDQIQVDGGGYLSFPLAGSIEARGKTLAGLQSAIEDRLRGRYLRDPQVTVALKETRSQVVTVDGQVQQPGTYPVIGDMSLVRAVALAHGVTEDAQLDDVVVFRTVKGQKLAALYNLKAIRRGVYDDPAVYANDTIIVGNSHARRIFEKSLTVVSALSYPVIAIVTSLSK